MRARDQLLAAEQEAAATGVATPRRRRLRGNGARSNSPPTTPNAPARRATGPPCGIAPRSLTLPSGWSERRCRCPAARPKPETLPPPEPSPTSFAALPADIGDHAASVCDAWLITGESPPPAPAMWSTGPPMLRPPPAPSRWESSRHAGQRPRSHRWHPRHTHPACRRPTDSPAAGATIRARHDLVTPPWLTVAITAQQRTASTSAAQHFHPYPTTRQSPSPSPTIASNNTDDSAPGSPQPPPSANPSDPRPRPRPPGFSVEELARGCSRCATALKRPAPTTALNNRQRRSQGRRYGRRVLGGNQGA